MTEHIPNPQHTPKPSCYHLGIFPSLSPPLQPSPTPRQFTSQDFLDPLTPSTKVLDVKCHFLNVSVGYVINMSENQIHLGIF